jgi:hypothetical protein
VINAAHMLKQNKMNSELFGNSALRRHLEGVRLVHRLTGKDLAGRPVRVDVRFPLRATPRSSGTSPSGSSGSSRTGSARAVPGPPPADR